MEICSNHKWWKLKNLPHPISTSVHQYISISVYQYISTSVYEYISISFFLLLHFVATSQSDSTLLQWSLQATIQVPVTHLTTDKVHQVYVITPDNILIKYSPDGKELFRYSNTRMGILQSIDVTDPFQLLLFYPDYRTVQVLDRTLSPVSKWQFDEEDVRAIAMSSDNNLWIYDYWTGQLKKVDRNNNVLHSSPLLSALLRDNTSPTQLSERDNFLYALFPGKGILRFDRYGQWVNTLPVLPQADFQVADQQLFYREGACLMAFHLTTLLTTAFLLPEREHKGKEVRLEGNYLFCTDEVGVRVYKSPNTD